MNAPKTVRILLAEDDSQHQHLLFLALTNDRSQVTVTVVGSGTEFLRVVGEQAFDCVVLDFNLQDYRADELLELAQEHLEDCPALVISSSDDQQVVVSTMRQGSVDFVPKSSAVQGDELWTRVERAIRLRDEKKRERRGLERRERHLADLAETDELTGLKNRRYFLRCLEQGRWRNDRRQAISCAMVDIDHFKQVNDQYGHDVGDRVLKAFANAITEHCGSSEVVIRWGGEEVLILKSAGAWVDEWLWAEALRQRIEAVTISVDDNQLSVTASIGLAQCRSRDFCQDTIKQADEALYLAKDQGRNVVCTSPMVVVARTLSKVSQQQRLTPEERRRELLRQLADHLGPTQWEHITNHCEKVSHMAAHIGRLLGMTAGELERLRVAGLMHDIGKCVIPEELLAKPRSLSAQEWALMARHDIYGAWITAKLGVDEPTTRHIQHHHERFDAPMRLELTNDYTSPDGPRVLCVADALVTMLTTRSYRAAMTIKHAVDELRRESGKQFDPDIVSAVDFTEGVAELMAA